MHMRARQARLKLKLSLSSAAQAMVEVDSLMDGIDIDFNSTLTAPSRVLRLAINCAPTTFAVPVRWRRSIEKVLQD